MASTFEDPRETTARRAVRRCVLTAMGLLLLGPGLPFAAVSETGEAAACDDAVALATAKAVQSRYEGIRDLSARFSQSSRSATFAGEPLMDAATKQGRVVFAKPGKMRWTYEEPEPSVVVSDGSTLWIHDVEGETATRLEVTAGYLSGAALQFLLGDGKLLDSFDVAAEACEGDQITLDLRPKEDATYERLGLVALRETGDIAETSVTDLFGNVTSIRFADVAVNQKPAAEVFAFEPPEGVEVIDYAAGAAGGL